MLDKRRMAEYHVTQIADGQGCAGGGKERSGMFTKGFYFYYFTVDCRFASV